MSQRPGPRLKAAIGLGVFTAIGEGAHTVAAVADRCQASERGIRILCDNLAIAGFVARAGTAAPDPGFGNVSGNRRRSFGAADFTILPRRSARAR